MEIRDLYHAAPLQYVPHILLSGALYAQSVLASQGITPRVSAARRDRMLGLADYVHFSLRADTPLLRDKLQKGYPHVLFLFEADAVFELPETALVRYNAKAWQSKSAYMPIADRLEMDRLLRQYAAGRYPSMEAVVKYGLSLDHVTQIAFGTLQEQAMTEDLLHALGMVIATSCVTQPKLFPGMETYCPTTLEAISHYFAQCCRDGKLLPPPSIPFD